MNYSHSFVLKLTGVLLVAACNGCGPQDGVAAFKAGQAAYETHDLKKASRSFEKSLKQAPENIESLVFLARVKIELGELAAARSALDRAASIAGGDIDVRMLDAQLTWHEKNYEKATQKFRAIAQDTSVDPTIRAQGWSGVGIVELACNSFHAARIAFFKAIRLDRREASAWYHLGMLYRDGFGYPESALEQFQIYVRLSQESDARMQKVQRTYIPELKDTIARATANRPDAAKRNSAACAAALAKAEAAVKKGDLKSARTAYQTAVVADAVSYEAALGLAKTVEKLDTTKSGQGKALQCYQRACSLRPSAVGTFLAAGAIASRLGQWAVSEKIYSRAVAANPASLEALDGLIKSLRKVGGKGRLAQDYQAYRDSLVAKKRK